MVDNGITLEELIEMVGDKELATFIWNGWEDLGKDPDWKKITKGKSAADLLGR